MQQIKFDFNNLFSANIGKAHGVTASELKNISGAINKARKHLKAILSDERNRINLGLEWAALPFQEQKTVQEIQKLGKEIAGHYENVLFLGIGGSYLGLKAAQDAFASSYYNEFSVQRKGCPKIYFEGNNLDPDTLSALLKNLNPQKTFVVVISKSGETTETKAAFLIVEAWLKESVRKRYGRQIVAITDPQSGSLREKVRAEQAKDALSFRNLPLLKGVGGRFSELNMGLLHLAIIGVKIEEVLAGARAMAKRCSSANLLQNPALLYAALSYILYRKKRKSISILMPFSEALRATADWYVQLLAESLGKKYSRKIKLDSRSREIWERDKNAIVNIGRTPLSSRGTTDLHSLQQNNVEGENNKVITFIRVEKFKNNLRVPGGGGFLAAEHYARLLTLAQEGSEWALLQESRPNCTIILPRVLPYHWGELIFFFEMATAFEGELLNINAFDQPGVEGYKNYMYYKLGKGGVSPEVIAAIKKRPLSKNHKFII